MAHNFRHKTLNVKFKMMKILIMEIKLKNISKITSNVHIKIKITISSRTINTKNLHPKIKVNNEIILKRNKMIIK